VKGRGLDSNGSSLAPVVDSSENVNKSGSTKDEVFLD